ncbi:unnamed protein product [Allacma fusca]|uniref:Uncharacterized protein n=1 Tax=Allacma fusca TaxID=39272 RepID=A0A8J2J5V4_9HEXA|nr:unnamed protein product [Allacma fusca]
MRVEEEEGKEKGRSSVTTEKRAGKLLDEKNGIGRSGWCGTDNEWNGKLRVIGPSTSPRQVQVKTFLRVPGNLLPAVYISGHEGVKEFNLDCVLGNLHF